MKTDQRKPIYFPARYARTPDGATIRYFDSEEPLPALVLANGLGGPACAWEPYVARFRGRLRVLTWDYRGLYGSTLPRAGSQFAPAQRNCDLDVSSHCDDLLAILNHAGVERTAYLGWSMGVQVGLEFYSQNSTRLSHLALISGTSGRPLSRVPVPFASLALPRLVQSARNFHGLGRKVLTSISRSRLSYGTLRTLGLIARGLARSRFEEMVREFETVDLDIYLRLLAALHEHDATVHLQNVSVPTLIMAGSRDIITPPWLARTMTNAIRGAELFIVPGATHYAAAEYPDVIAERLERFLGVSREPPTAQSSEFANLGPDS